MQENEGTEPIVAKCLNCGQNMTQKQADEHFCLNISKTTKHICELCHDKKHKTDHIEATFRIFYVHKKCWKQARQTLHKFFEKYGVGEPNFTTKNAGVQYVHYWLHAK